MTESSLSAYKSKKLLVFYGVMLSLLALAIGVGELFGGGAQAMPTSSQYSTYGNNYSASSSNYVPPYTGGAPIAKVLHPADGSTVTITSTGAVIKQSPGGTPYREGWINPSQIGGINTSASLKGQLASGATNPYVTSTSNQPSSYSPPAKPNYYPHNYQSSTYQPSQTYSPSVTVNQTSQPATTSNSNATANASANAEATVTASPEQAPAAQSSTTAVTTSSQPSSSTAAETSSSNFSGKSLPNTGPGSVLAIGGLTTVLGTIGHFLFQRFRYRSL